MIQRPQGIGAFEFAVLASLRAAQLSRGCLPRVNEGHTVAVMAQLEVARGKVISMPMTPHLLSVLDRSPRVLVEV